MSKKSLLEELNPIEMAEELKRLLGESHEHSCRELVEKVLASIGDLDTKVPFFGGAGEGAVFRVFASHLRQALLEFAPLWQQMVLEEYRTQLWPETTRKFREEVLQTTAAQGMEAGAKVLRRFDDLTREELDDLEVGATSIPDAVPVSWREGSGPGAGGYL